LPSVVKFDTGEEVLGVFPEYAHYSRDQQAIHSTLQFTAHGMTVEED